MKDELRSKSPETNPASNPETGLKPGPVLERNQAASNPHTYGYPRTYGFSGGFSGGSPVTSAGFERLNSSLWEQYRSSRKSTRRPTVLLVDPDPEKSRSLSVSLETDGYTTVSVGDGAEALRMARLLSVDLVICNLELVGRDHGHFVRSFRKTPNHADVPVILLTDKNIDDETTYLKFGADALCVEEEAEESVLALAAFYLGA